LTGASIVALISNGVASIGNFQSPLVLFWNTVSLGMAWASTVVSGRDKQMVLVFAGRLMMTSMVCIYAMLTKHRWTEEATKEIETMMLRENSSASQRLLSTFYDLVTMLDTDLNIVSSGHELARFLRSDLGISLGGTKFELLLHCDEERDLFLRRLQQPACEQESITDVLHVTMSCCTSGVQIPVELFILQYASIVGSRRYLIGIRDCGEEPAVPDQLHHEAVGDQIIIPSDATIVVNVFDPSFLILQSSQEFRQLTGFVPGPGSNLSDVVANAEELKRWMQQMLNQLLADQTQPSMDQDNICRDGRTEDTICRVSLRMQPPLSNLRADCRIEQIMTDGRTEEADSHNEQGSVCNSLLVCLIFLDPRAKNRASTPRNQRRRRRSGRRGPAGGSELSSSSENSLGQGTPRHAERRCLGREEDGPRTNQTSESCSDGNRDSL